MAKVMLEGVAKSFGSVQALCQTNLEVQEGEFLTILGASGSGKTTLLRLIAGLEVPDAGRILIGDRVVCSPKVWTPPQQRGIGMVFQHYALWPHMTAFENVAFALEAAGLASPQVHRRVRDVLALVELSNLEHKRPDQMSGGEQQRVALARALVIRPSILLMDECLSNLDARLREKMAAELRRVQETVGITTIYVTHDQQEALALSDRIAVLDRGELQQVGTPTELYRTPCNSLVATSLGSINLLSLAEVRQLGLPVPVPAQSNGQTRLGVRPENILVVGRQSKSQSLPPHGSLRDGKHSSQIQGLVKKTTFMGDTHHCWIDFGCCTLHAQVPMISSFPAGNDNLPPPPLSTGDLVWVLIEPEAWIVFN